MRDACSRELTSLARSDPRVVILSGDIGNHMFDEFKNEFPERFFNCGVAEANMISVAAGLALSGLRPFVYTFAAFDLTRCYEQIRVDLCFHNLPVVIIGLGGGLTYAPLGPTHYICEDISILRCLPNMTIVCPADGTETMAVLRASIGQNGPIYIRINKKNEPCMQHNLLNFSLGKAIIGKEGSDLCFISTGVIIAEVNKASIILEDQGVSTGIVHLHTIKPLDEQALDQIFKRYRYVVSVEEHTLSGGLGSLLAEWIVDHQVPSLHLLRLGTRDEFLYQTYTQKEAREYFGISGEQIAHRVLQEMRQ